MAKFDSKELLKRVKGRERPEKANVTFRFDTDIMAAFKAACKKQSVTPTSMLEEFMATFSKDMKT